MIGKTVSVNFIGDDESHKLNKQYRNKDYATDVLSFNYESDVEVVGENKELLGELYINIEQAKRQAKDFDNTLEEEIAELTAHGMLHLLGVHHEGDDH